jgi:MFS family permease
MILSLIIIASFLDVVDFSIVNVALPAIRTAFVVGLAESQWIIGAYGITMAGLLMLSDFRYAFLASTIINTVGLVIALRVKNEKKNWKSIIYLNFLENI